MVPEASGKFELFVNFSLLQRGCVLLSDFGPAPTRITAKSLKNMPYSIKTKKIESKLLKTLCE